MLGQNHVYLSVSGISKIMHCGMRINMPYSPDRLHTLYILIPRFLLNMQNFATRIRVDLTR